MPTAAETLQDAPPGDGAARRHVPPRPAVRVRKRRRWLPWAIGSAVLLLIVGGVVAYCMNQAAAAAAKAKTGEISTIGRGNVEHSVTSAGKVVSNLDVEIKCRASGEVMTLPFDVSEVVKEGDLLCQLDTKDEELQVRTAEANVLQAQAKLIQMKANLETARLNLDTTRTKAEAALASAKVKAENLRRKADRQKELIAQKLGSAEEAETAETEAAVALADQRGAEVAIAELKQQEIQLEFKEQDVKSAEAQLQADQIALDTQKQQLAYTTVKAPMAGTVSALNVQKGQIIASGLNAVNGGTTIMTLSDLSRIFVTATVDESDIGQVSVGQKARITVSSFPGRTFAGKVVRIAVKGVNTSNVVTFEVKVEVLDEAKNLLKPEMTGDVTIVEAERANVLTVPVAAVFRRDGKTFVKVVEGNKRHDQPITLGLEGTETTEVVSGLREGDKVVAADVDVPTRWKNDE